MAYFRRFGFNAVGGNNEGSLSMEKIEHNQRQSHNRRQPRQLFQMSWNCEQLFETTSRSRLRT